MLQPEPLYFYCLSKLIKKSCLKLLLRTKEILLEKGPPPITPYGGGFLQKVSEITLKSKPKSGKLGNTLAGLHSLLCPQFHQEIGRYQ